jgi:hypothetical protein
VSDDFEQQLERWLRERGRSDRETLAALAGYLAVLPPRRSRPRWPLLLAATVVVAVVATVASLPRFGQTSTGPETPPGGPTGPPAMPSPKTADLATYVGDGFTFAYPVDWKVLSTYNHVGLHGPTVAVAVGTGSFDLGCTFVPPESNDPSGALGGIRCPGDPEWEVPDDGVVVAYWSPPYAGFEPPPSRSPSPGEKRVEVGGRPAEASTAPNSMTWLWHLDELPWVIEARFGPLDLKANQAAVHGVIASWRWASGTEWTPTPSPTAIPATVPAWVSNLDAALDCAGPVQPIGGDIGSIVPSFSAGTASPQAWLDLLDDVDLPLSGWTEDPKVPWESGLSNYARYVNLVGGQAKAVLVMRGHSTDGGRGSWSVVAYRACTPAEFDPARGSTLGDAPWRDASGTVSRDVRANTGPGHCGWESAIFLHIDGRTYIRDPLGIFADRTVAAYLPDLELPSDATSTGLTSAGRELFTSPDEDFVWIRVGEVVERWPGATEDIGCT